MTQHNNPHTPQHDTQRTNTGPRVVHHAGPADWIRDHTGKLGIVGRALLEATRKTS